MKKWTIELTEQQLRTIADCVEDCHRFAAGQCELNHTTFMLDERKKIQETMRRTIEPYIAPNGYGSSCDWCGNGAKNLHQRKFIAMTYGIYREIIHQLTLASGVRNVYSSPTLTCAEQGGLPIVKQKDEK